MAGFRADINGGKIRGELSIWPSVAGGIAAGILLLGIVDSCSGGDGDINTYRPDDLQVEHFSAEPGLECRGLSPDGTSEIIASTIVCEPVKD